MKSRDELVKGFELKHSNFYSRLSDTLSAKIYFHKCSQCGHFVVVFCFEDASAVGTYGGHSYTFGHCYLNGGLSKGNRILCRHCLDMALLVDEVKDLEKKKKDLLNEIEEMGDSVRRLLEFVEDKAEKGK